MSIQTKVVNLHTGVGYLALVIRETPHTFVVRFTDTCAKTLVFRKSKLVYDNYMLMVGGA